jgi:hypothetical protein
MLSVTPYIDTRRATKKGYPVKVRIYDSKSRNTKLMGIGEYQTKKNLVMTSRVTQIMNRYQERIDFCNEHSLSWEESLDVIDKGFETDQDMEIAVLEARLRKARRLSFVDFRDFTRMFIEEKKSIGRATQAYEDALREVENYVGEQRFGMNDITYEWLNEYRLYKIRTGTKEGGGLSYYLRSLRTLYLEAQRRESLGVKRDNPFKGLIKNVVSQKTQNLQWQIGDLRKLLNFSHPNATNASQENMKRVVDLFLFQFAIGGHDFVELANLRWENIKNGRISFQRYKNRNKPNGGPWVDNMLSPFAADVIERLGTSEEDRVFAFIAPPGTEKYRNQNRYAGKTLQRVSKVLEIEPKLMTKTPRYIFRTIAGELLISDLIIETLQGHKPTSITFKYQKGVSHSVLDKEHSKILKTIWDG